MVVAIIGMLAALAMGGLSNTVRSSKLTNTAQRVAVQINVARQVAAARNLPVEVRFYKLPWFDQTIGGARVYRGMQTFVTDGITFTNPVSKPFLFPNRVAIRIDSPLRGMIKYVDYNSPGLADFGIYGRGTIGYNVFTIRPNGMLVSGTSTNISATNNFMTLQNWEPDSTLDSSVPTPANYALVRVDPITAKVTILRP